MRASKRACPLALEPPSKRESEKKRLTELKEMIMRKRPPPRNGTSFDAAVNTIITEYVAEILEYVDKKARKLHKMKQVVMRPATNWNNCRMHYFPFVPGRDPDPTGDAFASCFELVDNRALLPCDKKGCCVVKPPSLQSAGKAVVVCSETVSSVASSGKAKMVYNGKAKA